MKVYINSNGEIKDVYSTNNPNLEEVEITDGTFDGMSPAKICCYKIEVENGSVRMMTLYVSDKIVDVIDGVSVVNQNNTANIDYIAMETGVEL